MFETSGREAPEHQGPALVDRGRVGRRGDRPTSTSVASGVLREGPGDVKHILPSWALQGFFKDKEAESPGETAPVDWSTVETILYGPRLHRKLNLLRCDTLAPHESGRRLEHFRKVSHPLCPETFSFIVTKRDRSAAMWPWKDGVCKDAPGRSDCQGTTNELVRVWGAPPNGATCTC